MAFIISFVSLGAACFVSSKTKTLMDTKTKPKITPIKMRNFDHKWKMYYSKRNRNKEIIMLLYMDNETYLWFNLISYYFEYILRSLHFKIIKVYYCNQLFSCPNLTFIALSVSILSEPQSKREGCCPSTCFGSNV